MKRHVYVALVTAALAGCSSGGGGNGGPSGPASPPPGDSSSPPESTPPESTPPASTPPENSPPESGPPAAFEYRTLATVSGDVRVSSAVPTGPVDYGALRNRITATADGAGNFTFQVNDPTHGPYTFTVNVPPNTSFTIKNGTEEVVLASLTYSAAGVWGRPDIISVSRSGAAAFGVATRAADLPRTGTASYSGAFIGIANSDFANFGVVNASASSLANFGTGRVSFETTGSRLDWGTGQFEAAPYLDLSGSMTFQSSGGVRQNSLRGPVATKPGGWGISGEVRANFYGPASSTSPPPELSGSVAVGKRDVPPGFEPGPGGGEGRALIGGFVMKR